MGHSEIQLRYQGVATHVMNWRIETDASHHAGRKGNGYINYFPVMPLQPNWQEALALGARQCGFESLQRYQKTEYSNPICLQCT